MIDPGFARDVLLAIEDHADLADREHQPEAAKRLRLAANDVRARAGLRGWPAKPAFSAEAQAGIRRAIDEADSARWPAGMDEPTSRATLPDGTVAKWAGGARISRWDGSAMLGTILVRAINGRAVMSGEAHAMLARLARDGWPS